MRRGSAPVGGLVAAALLGGGLLVAPSSAGPRSQLPHAWSVVDLGRDVPYEQSRPCSSPVRVVASFAGKQVAGPSTRGCSGVVRVPSRDALVSGGWAEGTGLDLSLRTRRTSVPLRYKHSQPDLGRVMAGNPSTAPALGDPQGDANSLLMATGDAVDLGPVDLRGVYAVLVRAAGVLSFELRSGSVTGRVLASGTAGHARPDWAIKPRGTGERYQSVTAPLARPPGGAVHLVLTVTQGAGLVNYVDLTGSGAMAPYRPAPLPKAVRVFDGRSLAGWKQIGPGRFAVDPDGSLRATGPGGVGQWGWLYNPRFPLTNFVLRLQVKEEAFGANGGILVRHSSNDDNNVTSFTADEVQVTDVNTEYTGGIDHVATALLQPQSSPGEWSTMEIVANGPHLVVRVNGVVTADHHQTSGCNMPSLPCSGGAYGGYGTGGSGFIGFEAELMRVWYRDIEVHDCGVTDVVRRTTTDPLCDPRP